MDSPNKLLAATLFSLEELIENFSSMEASQCDPNNNNYTPCWQGRPSFSSYHYAQQWENPYLGWPQEPSFQELQSNQWDLEIEDVLARFRMTADAENEALNSKNLNAQQSFQTTENQIGLASKFLIETGKDRGDVTECVVQLACGIGDSVVGSSGSVDEEVSEQHEKLRNENLKSSIEEAPELELKELPEHLEYAFLGEGTKLPVIIATNLTAGQKQELVNVLKKHKKAIAWKIADIKGINPSFCTHKILMEDDHKPSVLPQRRLNPNMKEVVRAEVIKLLDAGIIYPISDSEWVSPVQVVPKKGGMTVITNEKNELIPTRTVTGWRVCIDYRKLNDATRKDHFPLPFIDQMLERLAGHPYYCFLDGFSGYFQIPIAPEDQEKTTFTCPYGTFAYRRMPFGLCNAPATFQRCMMAIFEDMVEDFREVMPKLQPAK